MPKLPGLLVVAAMMTACTASPGPGEAAPVQAAAPARVTEPVKPAGEPARPAGPIAAAPDGPGEDWLVWWFRDGAWTTRWLRVAGADATLVGERKALIVGDAARLWQIERADAEVDVKQCQCEGDDPDRCPVIGKVGKLGLRARELGGTGTVAIQQAETDAEWGDDIEYGLTIVGGAQAKLAVEDSQSGYFCGAHGVYDTQSTVFDVAAGAKVELAGDWARGLPDALRRTAATAIQKDLNECDGSDLSIDDIMNTRLGFGGAALALVGGAPTVQWKLTASVMYICSPDYRLTGTASSGLIPEAAALGLAGPLPPGLTRPLAEIGDAGALGFSRLQLGEAGRAATLAAFVAAPEPAWPREQTKLRGLTASAAQAKLAEGRKWTRANDLPRAIAAFDEAIRLDDGLASAYSGRGYARMLAGAAAEAKADMMIALEKDDDAKFQAAVWFNLGGLAEQARDLGAARAAYTKSQALRATEQASEALAALDRGK